MRYSFVLATLAASAIATPYINVEVSEPGEIVADNNKNHHHNDNNHRDNQHDGMRRHHRGGRNDRDDRDDRDDGDNNSWFSIFWRKNRNDNDRRGRNGRHGRDDRRGRDGRRGDGRGRDHDRDNNDDFHTSNLMDGLFGSDYECVIQAVSGQKERKDARECCREVGGELYDVAGRCVFRDVYENPRDEWRTCAIEQSGAVFADCYYREQREVDDELNSRRRNSHSRSGSRDDEDRERRNRNHNKKNHRDRKGRDNDRNDRDRNGDDHQVLLADDDQPMECKLNLDDNQFERHIIDRCCRLVDGNPTHHHQRCELFDEESVMDFEECVAEKFGVDKKEIQCSSANVRTQRENEFECRLDLGNDRSQREITRQCCKRYVHGDLTHHDQRCEVRDEDDTRFFKHCVDVEASLPEDVVECKRINRQEEF